MTIATTIDEERACGALLYRGVRVTVELLAEKAAAEAEPSGPEVRP